MNVTAEFEKASFIRDPYPYYETMREREQPCWLELDQNLSPNGMWLFSRYDDALDIFKLEKGVSKQVARLKDPDQVTVFDLSMLNQDPPAHTRLRGLANRAFTPKRVDDLSHRIKQLSESLIDNILKRGDEFDFIAEFARPLPVIMISDLLGVPLADQEKIKLWSANLTRSFDSHNLDTGLAALQNETLTEMAEYFSYLLNLRNDHPQRDLISEFSAQHKDGGLSLDEAIGMCILLLFAGHETSINLLGNGMYLLLNHQDQLAKLENDLSLMPSAVEEILRIESPAQRSTFRVTTEAINIGNHTLESGQQFSAIIGSANRDERAFPEANKFDIARKPNKHLAFGLGIHTCLGLTLARKEAEIGFHRILERLPNLEMSSNNPEWNKNTFIRGLQRLPLRIK